MGSAALFSKTPPLKLFFLASIPGAISMLASALYQMLDGIFVGQFLELPPLRRSTWRCLSSSSIFLWLI